ncbi:uncharacterized protein ASPGLDRAFT_915880 [Aspergillus glaucus CBS 516.65]|uniref:Uncharacterized protein n=1 Tax=Aspergillus glaucus CBS 516.65 TaxID=1160497 RepID=A0A1L9V7N7_ASPGL|nr:hypothetical protein ASPGLDRAFT_915880 [Aspergillus glaucus CBS 516.65]OJJ79852.1 hypothetical protein ASPGLDRAFT_915880 [Aspergillus glaucus CBS 516.65]
MVSISQVMAPAPGERSPQGYINLDEDLFSSSFVKLSVNRYIFKCLLFLFCFFFFFLTSLSLNHFLAVHSHYSFFFTLS